MFVQSLISPFVHSLLVFPFTKHKLNLFYFTSLDRMMTSNIIKNISFFDEPIHQISSIISILSLLSYSQSVNHPHNHIRNVISFLFFLSSLVWNRKWIETTKEDRRTSKKQNTSLLKKREIGCQKDFMQKKKMKELIDTGCDAKMPKLLRKIWNEIGITK